MNTPHREVWSVDRHPMRPAGSTLGVRPAGSRPEEVQSTLGVRLAGRCVFSANNAPYVLYRTVSRMISRDDASSWLKTLPRFDPVPLSHTTNAFTSLLQMGV